MIRFADPAYWFGSALAAVALIVAAAAIARGELPLLGGATGALLAVALLGIAGCAIGGISQAPGVGWSAPTIVVGTVLGVAAAALIVAGLFGWTAVLQPVAAVLSWPIESTPPARIALVGLAIVIAAKWLIATAMSAFAR
jgi:hypothetical protein